jgi:hypothetical protein
MYSKCLELEIVWSLWAMVMIVNDESLCSAILSIAACTSFSLFGSSALVASSSIRIFGFLISALAIAILYFWPPDKFEMVDDPMYVSSLCSKS